MEHECELDFCTLGVFTMGEEFEPHETGFVLNMLIDTYPHVKQWRVNTGVMFSSKNEGPRHVLVMLFPPSDDPENDENFDDDDIFTFTLDLSRPDPERLN